MPASTIRNPILPGFNPDPSIVRVGDDYYIATSTFEWFPGVQIHHSRDLVHWRLLTRPLDRVSQLDLRGVRPSAGIWAPCLTYADGLFWLIYTVVRTIIKDQPNYVVTAPAITGPWSEPAFLNGIGFDPSLFHDDDGKKYLVQMAIDPHRRHNPFKGIYLTEFDPSARKLVGPRRKIFQKCLGETEGPHLYKRNGLYYLMVAEGGTGYDHAVTVARSKNLWGPYEADPQTPVITSRGRPELALQKAGHGSLVETQTGEWYIPHLCGRPLPLDATHTERRCILGRETALQRVEWTDDGWLRLLGGGNAPAAEVPAPALPPHPFPPDPETDHFDTASLGLHWQTLRTPADSSWVNLTERPGFLRLYGRDSIQSHFDLSMVARRIDRFKVRYETSLDFSPNTPWQMAGLTAFYGSENYYFLAVSRGDDHRRRLLLFTRNNQDEEQLIPDDGLILPDTGMLHLAVHLDGWNLQFFWAGKSGEFLPAGPVLDSSILSDEIASWGFTGTFIGLCAQDLEGTRQPADFDSFTTTQLPEK